MEKNLFSTTGDYLIAHKIKPSFQRIKIFEYIRNSNNHPTVDEIYKHIVKDIPTLSKTTVYNTLNLFIDKDIASVITIEENETRYDVIMSHHGHFKCTQCGRIYDVTIDMSDLHLDTLEGFKIDEKHLYFKGKCKICLNQ